MPFALFALAMINVAVGTQGFAFAGVLADIAKDLGITIGQAGVIVGASSITFAIGAPLLRLWWRTSSGAASSS
jgi:MFS transporter, DHA1 family, inner membrane transport protein